MKSRSQPIIELHRHPWFYFFLFLASNTLLSFFPFSRFLKIFIGFFGILVPLILGIGTVLLEKKKKKFPLKESPAFRISGWVWAFFFGLLLLTHFYKLLSLPLWLIGDEGIFGVLGLRQSQHWDWRLLWGGFKNEPFLFWALGVYFKSIQPSFFSLRLFPALFSFLTIGAAYLAARLWFSRSLAFVYVWLYSFSFWQFSLMRYAQPNILIPLFVFLALIALRFYFKPPHFMAGWGIVPLAVTAGLGFYAYVNWAPVWAGLVLTLGLYTFQPQRGMKSLGPVVTFILVSFTLVLPLIFARFSLDAMTYIQGNWVGPRLLKMVHAYVVGLFWNSSAAFPLGSDWGGMFDPLTGSLIFTGVIYAFQRFNGRFLFLFWVVLGMTLLPGFLTNNLEMNRISPSLPLWLFLAVLGLEVLSRKDWNSKFPYVLLFLTLIAAVNIYNFADFYCDLSQTPSGRQWLKVQFADAYQKLTQETQEKGALYVFDEFNVDYNDKTLKLAVYPFNALENPALAGVKPVEAVFILNYFYIPYLKHHYAGLRYTLLKTDQVGPIDPKPFALVFIPLSSIPPSTLEKWKTTNAIFSEMDLKLKSMRHFDLWADYIKASPFTPDLLKDPLVAALYWEKRGLLELNDKKLSAAYGDFETAIHQIPAAHLYYLESFCRKWQGRTPEAKRLFKESHELAKKFN